MPPLPRVGEGWGEGRSNLKDPTGLALIASI
jgi:hypothetical protein